jgi:hypothetical protein
MIAAIPGQGVADLSPLTQAMDLSTDLEWVPEVPAAHLLAQISAECSGAPDLGCGHGMGSFNEHVAAILKKGRLYNVGELREGTYLQCTLLFLDIIETRDCLDINDSLRIASMIFSLEA